MAPSDTLPHSSAISQISKHGVLTLCGFGIRVTMQSGHLEIEDGIGLERRKFRLPRVNHGLKRLVVIGSDGFISLAAMHWLTDQAVAFTMLERDGEVLCVTGPVHPSDARLRRAQALAYISGKAPEISRELISAKLEGQGRVVREQLKDLTTADLIARFREQLNFADNLDTIRRFERESALAYWSAWHDVAIQFLRKDEKRVPAHWLRFGTRRSPLTGGPRLAINPPNAILNYTFAVAESECRLAASACGLDPGIGFLHVDTPNRDSLALDLIEPIRPAIEAWVLDWVMREPLRRSEFLETANGNCRISSHLCSKLSETAPAWGKLVAPWAEFVAHALWSGTSQSKTIRVFKTPLTQNHRREAKGAESPKVKAPKPDTLCRGCGRRIPRGKRYCQKCTVPITRHNFEAGRKMAQQPEPIAKRSATQRQHRRAIENWNPAKLPAWLTRDVYLKQIQPALATVPKSRIRSVLGVSEPYSIYIQTGERIPHQRHWLALAQLIGIDSSPTERPPEPMQ